MKILMDVQNGMPFDANNSPVAVEIKENRVWVTFLDEGLDVEAMLKGAMKKPHSPAPNV